MDKFSAATVPVVRIYVMATKAQERIILLLSTPSSVADIQDHLGISRQRITYILAQLLSSGVVSRRKARYRRAWMYYISNINFHPAENLILSDRASNLLSYLDCDRPVDERDLKISHGHKQYLDDVDTLINAGFAKRINIGRYSYLVSLLENCRPITPLALKEIKRANLIKDFGEIRSQFLIAFLTYGKMNSRELRLRVSEDIFRNLGYSYSQVLQRLKKNGYISGDKEIGHARYSLTIYGREIAEIISRYCNNKY